VNSGDFSDATIMVVDIPRPKVLLHFSHFMSEYFVDIALWCHDNPGRHIVVQDCGQCNPWFGLLESVATVTILPVAEVNNLTKMFPDNVWVSRGRFEFGSKKIGPKLRRFAKLISADVDPDKGHPRVFALRTSDPQFYPSGSWMRRISNEDKLARTLRALFSFESVEFFETTPREAVEIMSSCTLFVAQRGAALMNLMFMPEGSTVVEIYPRDFQATGPRIERYRRTCAALGFRHVRISQRSRSSAVSPIRLALVLMWIRLSSPFAKPASWPNKV
jgi:hypothetical protein